MIDKELITRFDHLVFGCSTLDEGKDFIYNSLGVIPEAGGQHFTMGTHNKLVKLDDASYLELIAVDNSLQKPNRPRWFNLDNFPPGSKPKLLTWVIRTNNIIEAVRLSGLEHGEIISLQRGIYNWQITIPVDGHMALGGVAPALIQWQNQNHPSQNLQESGVKLLSIEAFLDSAYELRSVLKSINFQGSFVSNKISGIDKPRLVVALAGPKGIIKFSS